MSVKEGIYHLLKLSHRQSYLKSVEDVIETFNFGGGIGPQRTARQFLGLPRSYGLKASGDRRLSQEPLKNTLNHFIRKH